MINRKNKILTAVIAVCIMFTATSCTQRPFGGMMGGGVPVTAVTLTSSQVKQSGIYQATLISRNSVSLQPRVEGQIADIFATAGDKVKAGQLLLTIDKAKQQATLNSMKADAAAAKALLHSYYIQRKALESAYGYNRNMFERYTALYKKKSVSKQDLEKYTDSFNKAEADLEANTAQIANQQAILDKTLFDIKAQQEQLQYYKITAPFSGIVGDIPVKTGNFVSQTTQLLSITKNDKLEVNVGLPVEKVFEIKEGLPIEVLDNKGEVIGTTAISFVSPKVDTETQTVLVKAILDNSSGVLKADQSVKVRVIFNKSQGVLIPAGAVSHFGGQDFAYGIEQKGKQTFVKQIPIKIGELQGDKFVVINGIKAGDKIVSEGIQKLMDGAPVMILPANIPQGQLTQKGHK
jgi:RND family efflux transporter MFP subunit